MNFGSGRRYPPQQQPLDIEADESLNDDADLDDRAVEADLSFNDAAGLDITRGRRGQPESERLCRP